MSTKIEHSAPMVTQCGFLDMQVCVPADWTDDQTIAFLESEHPCGTTNGWFVRKEGSKRLYGHPKRVPCEGRDGFVHIMLEA